RARGGRLVVVDPRRSETARLADRHLFIRPGGDAPLLLALLQVLFTERLVRPGPLAPHLDRLGELEALAAEFSPERVAPATGVEPDEVRALARELAAAPSAAVYGRVGVCTQEFGGLASWLINAVNIATGNLDRPDRAMLSTPPIDIIGLASRLGPCGLPHQGGYRRDRQPRPAGRRAVPDAADRHRRAGLAPGRARQLRPLPQPGARAGGVRRRAAGLLPGRGDRHTRAGPDPRPHHLRRQPGAVDPERRPARARAGPARLHGVDRLLPERDHAAGPRHPAADLRARARPRGAGRVRGLGAQRRARVPGPVPARAGPAARLGDLPRADEPDPRARRAARPRRRRA